MNKADRKKLNAALDMALSPPRKIQKQALDALLDEYDRVDAPTTDALVQANENPRPRVAEPEGPQPKSPPTPAFQMVSNESYSEPLQVPVSPQRDYVKVPNSLTRDAIPSGLFKGNSKQLYDALYLRTRGAMPPRREIQARQTDLLQWAGVSLNTLRAHVRHLISIHLIHVTFALGDNSGAIYEVRVLEEVSHLLPPPTTPSYHLLLPPPTTNYSNFPTESGIAEQSAENKAINFQNSPLTTTTHPLLPPPPTTPSTLLPEIGRRRPVESIENKVIYGDVKTYNDDDDVSDDDTHTFDVGPWALLLDELTNIVCMLQGHVSNNSREQESWREVGQILAEELKHAAARTDSITSVPAFLAAHLRRKFGKGTKKEKPLPVSSRAAKTKLANLRDNTTEPTRPTTTKNLTTSTRENNIGPASQYSFADCLKYAEYLQQSGRGITNPGGLANTLHRTGMSDSLIARFLRQETPTPMQTEPEAPQRFDEAEIKRQLKMTWNLVESKTHTIPELEENFGAFLHPEDWKQIKSKLVELTTVKNT